MKLQLRVAMLVLLGTAAVLASTAAVEEAEAAQHGGHSSSRGHHAHGGSWRDAPGRLWQGRRILGVQQCGWRCMMPASTGRTWQYDSGRIWQRNWRHLLTVTEQPQAPAPAAATAAAAAGAGAKESAQQWRDSMPASFGREWQAGGTGRIWQG